MLISYFSEKNLTEVGVDEAGRGPLAGPVVAAAVVLPFDCSCLSYVKDSKKLSEKKRTHLAPLIKEESLAFGIGAVSAREIDQINILQATFKAMHLAIKELQKKIKPDLLLIDGNRFLPYSNIPYRCIVRGDSLFSMIAAASILAKDFRDKEMKKLHAKYPVYDWIHNKGYPTRKHRESIKKNGFSPYHRKSFGLKS